MKKFALLLFCIAMIAMQVVNAQTRRITGTVTSAVDNTSIPGVSVLVKGTTIGVVTDRDGKYSLDVPDDATTLIFSFVGMKAKEAPISGAVVNAALESEVLDIDEVMVVAYGTTTKQAKTGSATQVETSQLSETPVVSMDKALSGKVAGLMVSTSGGQPGSSSKIRIRGTSSINAGSQPLYVVDGVPIMSGDQTEATTSSSALYLVNPSDIESITVLKDAAAASIYGSRAANGVILITTKSGKLGEAKISFRVSGGFSQLANDNNFQPMNSEQIWTYMRDACINSGYDPDDPSGYGNTYFPKSLLAGPQTNWFKEGIRKGFTQKYELTASGGTDKLRNYFSASYENIEGIVIGSDYEKFNFRANSDFQINKKLKIGAKIGLARMATNNVSTGGLSYLNPFFGSLNILPWTRMYNDDGTYNTDIPENSDTNPVYAMEVNEAWDKQFRMQSIAYLEYNPIKQLTLKSSNSAELTNGSYRSYGTQDTGWTLDALYTGKYSYYLITTSNTINYSDDFNDKHIYSILAGQEATAYRKDLIGGESPDINPYIPYPTTSTSDADAVSYEETEYTMLSFFGNLDYNYDSKYYFHASIRWDGSSRFGENNKYGTFWSVGASWNINKESFMEAVDWINLAKLRASYGINGNNQIGNYLQYGVYSSIEYNGGSGMAPSQLGNPDLTWEVNRTYNIGLDLAFFDRLNFTVDYYQRFTEDMLLEDQLSRTSGFTDVMRNVGEMENKGIELSVSGDVVKQNDFKVEMGVNLAHNKTKITDLAGEDEIGTYRVQKVGYSLYTFKLHDYAGVNPANGEAIWYDEDGNITNDYSKSRQIYCGSPEPKWIGGGFINATWKGLSLVASADFKTGVKVDVMNEGRYLRSDGYNWGSNQANTSLDYWKEPGDITETPKPTVGNASESNAFQSTRWLEDGDYLRLKEITLAYDFPQVVIRKINFLSKARIYVSGYNVYTFHSVNTFDPERDINGHSYGIYPTPKTFIAGIEVTF